MKLTGRFETKITSPLKGIFIISVIKMKTAMNVLHRRQTR